MSRHRFGIDVRLLPNTGPSCDEGDSGQLCDESTWPDKDHCLICADCKVLVNNFQSTYQGSCTTYLHVLL